jgi:hypothetical protein
MHIVDLTREYSGKSDEELLHLVSESEELTQAAQTALAGELAKRRINVVEHLKLLRGKGTEPRVEQTGGRRTRPKRESPHITKFLADVLSLYHSHFWLFLKLIAPAVVVGYVAILMGRHEGRELARHIPRGIEAQQHKTEMLEIFLANQLGYCVSWLASCLSFAAICSAVQQLRARVVPSFHNSFAAVRGRIGSFLRLVLLLYFLLLTLFAVALAASVAIIRILGKNQGHPNFLMIEFVSFAVVGLALLVFSRFALAIPALILDNFGVARSMFRSDELTEGTWLTLAALLAKSLIAGYVAGMFPFWIASRIPARILLPSWFPWLQDAASIAGVIVVEPTMFIGFALLYIRMSGPLTPSGDGLGR